jgi:hypothetical protein
MSGGAGEKFARPASSRRQPAVKANLSMDEVLRTEIGGADRPPTLA